MSMVARRYAASIRGVILLSSLTLPLANPRPLLLSIGQLCTWKATAGSALDRVCLSLTSPEQYLNVDERRLTSVFTWNVCS